MILTFTTLYLLVGYGYAAEAARFKKIRREITEKVPPHKVGRHTLLVKVLATLMWPAAIGSLLAQANLYMDRFDD